jgi:hypothetical protein
LRTYTGREVHRKECLVDAIHLPVGLTLPSAFGAPAAPLQAGQVIQALVLELIQSDVFRLQLPQATIDVRSSVPLTPGSTITLAVKGTGSNTRLAIYSDAPTIPSGSIARAPATAPNITGRTPIGEAMVIARTPAGQGAPVVPQNAAAEGGSVASAQAKTTPQPAVLREAPASAPAPPARPAEAPARAVTPAQAVTEAIQIAAPRQAGLAPLFADLEQIVRTPNAAASPIPFPVRQAARDVLSLRVPLDEHLAGADLKQAFVRSGVLLEPRLAAVRGAPTDARAPFASAPSDVPRHTSETSFQNGFEAVPTPRDDLKSALLVFRQVLKVWGASFPAMAIPERPNTPLPAGSQPAIQVQTPAVSSDVDTIRHVASALAGLPEDLPQRMPLSPEQASSLAKSLAAALTRRDAPETPATHSSNAVPLPYRGAPLAVQAVAAPSIMPDAAPQEIAHKLIAETDGALARQTLLQAASLPEQPSQPRAEAVQRWNFEVPFATPQGTAVAQFEVSRDGGVTKADPQARTWRARFSLDVEPMGPVHAMIALSGVRTSVTLWAERAATATRLNEHAPRLNEALRAAELEPADFQFRVGAPPAMAKQAAPGRFMDRAS